MRQFLVFIVKILIALLASALILDFGYTYIYSNSIGRNKVENVINTNNKKFDVIMMGSSRANNHFVSQLFIDKGYKAFNYGISGSKSFSSILPSARTTRVSSVNKCFM